MSATKKVVAVDAAGQKQISYQPFTKALPGDEIIYQINYTYAGSSPAEAVVIDGPVPAYMTLIAGSEASSLAGVTYSIDGGSRFAPLAELMRTEPDGSTRAAQIEDVTTIRWAFKQPLSPNSQGSLSYTVKLK